MMVALFLVMTILGSFGAIALKLGAGAIRRPLDIFTCKWVYLGGLAYVLSAIVNIYLLWRMDYSRVLPMTALTYVWTLPLSHFVLGEKIGIHKIVAIALIVSGVCLVAMF